ncbi:MAG: LysM peptidoglycan-binding domain-containing protein [Candidatus Dormibacteria bacterium]
MPVWRGLPNWSQVVAALTQNGIPDAVLLQALAMICWLLWLDLAVAVCAEVIAVARGRPVRLPGFASSLQPVAAQLIAATLLAITALSIRPTATPAPGLRAAMAMATVSGEPHLVAVASSPPASMSAPAGGDSVYVVRRGDTLWAIAQRKLGDALRWPQVFDLNRGRLQPDRRALLDPHWIYPGWVFDLPDDSVQRPGATGTSHNGSNGSSPLSAAAGAAPAPATRPTAAPTPLPPSASSRPEVPRPTPPAPRPHQVPPQTATRVVLPTGDVVGIGLAVAIAAAVGVARLRGRHRRGEDHSESPAYLRLLTPAVRRLSAARWRAVEPGNDEEDASAPPLALNERRDQPGVISIGDVGGQALTVEIGQLGGTGFAGDGAAGVIRHLIVAFLQHAAPDRAEVTLIGEFATLAPSAREVPAVKAIPDWETALGHLEVELVGRTRTLDEHEVPDFAALTKRCPAEPLSALLVVATHAPDMALHGRVRSLVAALRRLGIGVVFLGPSLVGDTVTVAADGEVHSVSGDQMASARAARLYTLAPSAAAELLSLIAASRGAPIVAAALPEEALPVTMPPPREKRTTASRSVHLSLFADLPTVRIDGDPLDDVLRRLTPARAPLKDREGLRRKGREILAFLALHPGGATIETLLAALFSDDDPDNAVVRLRRDIYNVRDVLRRATQVPDAKFIVFSAERYQLNADLIEADVWTLERGFEDLRAAGSSRDERADALGRILSAYGGQLLAHSPYEWVDLGLRENYVRRLVDAALKLSEMLEQGSDVDGALEAAEMALATDRDAEALYRRVMTLQLTLGRRDAAKRTLRELEARLSEIDAEPAEETVRLLQQVPPTSSHGI